MISIKAGDSKYDERTGRTVIVNGRHFSDFDVTIEEDVYNGDEAFGDDDSCETVRTSAIFTQGEIDMLFGHGRHVAFIDEDEDEDGE